MVVRKTAVRVYDLPMITGAHAIIYSTDAEADRAFFRDVLPFPHVDVPAAPRAAAGYMTGAVTARRCPIAR